MKVALVHDFLKEYGGAERVLEAIHAIYPSAPVYTSFVDWDGLGVHKERFKNWDIRQSPFGKTWLMRKFHSPLRFLAPFVWEYFDFSSYDVVISSSGWYMCRSIITKPQTVHISYLHHPPRHLYGYQTALHWQKYGIVRIYAAVINHFLRLFDFIASSRVDYFIANSQETKKRIEKFYRRESVVIYPPVEIKPVTGRIPPFLKEKEYYLTVSRLAHAKHIDLAIKACASLGKQLVVVGKGREQSYLQSMAKQVKANVYFLGEVADEDLPALYKSARALIAPFEDEEFGISAVEAMGYGTPVIVYNSGGLPETFIEGKTGIQFDILTEESLSVALQKLEHMTIQASDCIKRARIFSKEQFQKQLKSFIAQVTT